MQPLHHLAFERDGAARGILRQLECGDDLAGALYFLRRRREDDIAGFDLAGMDQRLAVKTEIARLRALQIETVDIAEIAIGTVEDLEATGAGGANAVDEHRQHD